MKVGLIPNTPMKILLEPYTVELGPYRVNVPVGFAFDGISLPRSLQFLRSPNSNDDIIADIPHAFFYSSIDNLLDRKEADLKLLEDMKGWGKYIIYIGLRLGGWTSWKKDSNFKKYRNEIVAYRKELGFRESIS